MVVGALFFKANHTIDLQLSWYSFIFSAYTYCNVSITNYNKGITNNNTLKENTMTKVNSVYSTENGGYSADIYKVSFGYKVNITRNNKTQVYYCKSESRCYNVINNTTK